MGDVPHPSGEATTGQTGVIGHVHAGGIDAPLGMVRNGTGIVLHRNWRGLYAAATDTAGAPTTCPVSGKELAEKTVYVDHEGRRVYFCCEACPDKFTADPAKYFKVLGGAMEEADNDDHGHDHGDGHDHTH